MAQSLSQRAVSEWVTTCYIYVTGGMFGHQQNIFQTVDLHITYSSRIGCAAVRAIVAIQEMSDWSEIMINYFITAME